MPLESATYISDLNAANPLSTDSVSQSDDHLRLIKSAIKATFPNITGPVTATQSALNAPFSPGMIMLWAGTLLTIPSGWALCDGTNGTPNLRDKFVVGAGTSYAVGANGGSTTSTAAGGHTHTEAAAGGHNHTGTSGSTTLTVDQIPSHTHTYNTATYQASVGTGFNGAYDYKSTSSTAPTASTTSTGGGQGHTHTISTDGSHSHSINSVGDHTHTVTPPYYALAYIMKL